MKNETKSSETRLSFEISISQEEREHSPELDRLINAIENAIDETDELYLSTAILLKEILVSSAERIKMTYDKTNPDRPFKHEELENIKQLVFENWKGSVSLYVRPQHITVQLDTPDAYR